MSEQGASPSPIEKDVAEESRGAAGSLARTFASFALQDWVCILYLCGLLIATALGSGPTQSRALAFLAIDIVVVVAGFLAARLVRSQLVSGLIYRFTISFTLLGSFFQLDKVLPTAASRVVDAQLLAIDMRVFHFEPSLSWDRFVTPTTTEWFSFFYFGYFFILGIHLLPAMFAERRMRLLSELAWGIVWVFCVGQLIYLVVPGQGPYAYLANKFEHPLVGSLWWGLVKSSVDSVDEASRLDIFPSLHTATPTFLTLFSFRNRKHAPFKYTWLPLALVTSQIIGATMFLRWHYLIDVCAGLLLASSAIYGAARVVRSEQTEREKNGLPPVFRPLWGDPK